MTRPRRPGNTAGDYTVGYARPPIATRFQPGQSGNPRGRPKGVQPPAAILNKLLNKHITVQVDGRKKRMTMQEVILNSVVNNAARGDYKAVQLLQTVLQRYAAPEQIDALPDTDELTPNDEALLADLVHRHGGTWRSDRLPTPPADGMDPELAPSDEVPEEPT